MLPPSDLEPVLFHKAEAQDTIARLEEELRMIPDLPEYEQARRAILRCVEQIESGFGLTEKDRKRYGVYRHRFRVGEERIRLGPPELVVRYKQKAAREIAQKMLEEGAFVFEEHQIPGVYERQYETSIVVV